MAFRPDFARVARGVAASALVLTFASGLAPAGASTTAAQARCGAYQLCNFDDPSVPKGNSQYPFAFPLSTRLESTANRSVREAVKSVQEVLRAEDAMGMDGQELVADGKFGADTRHAVRMFQRRNHLTVNGKVGQQTWAKLASNCWKYH